MTRNGAPTGAEDEDENFSFGPNMDLLVGLWQFKATEPYFDDYRTFHLERAIEKRGFMFPSQLESSPRHRTIVAVKK